MSGARRPGEALPTQQEYQRTADAIVWVHATVCEPGGIHGQAPCRACPTGTGTLRALRLLDQRPRDARGARRELHDVVCMSEHCVGDHADRTQSKTAAALRKFRAQEEPR